MVTGKIFTNENCVGCNLCISNCPCDEANVAVMENGRNKIYIDGNKCILCGECMRSCKHDAREYLDDTDRFFADLQKGKRISLIVAPAVRTNFEQYKRLFGFLRSMGVAAIYDTSFGADICTWAYLRYMTQNKATGLISQPCPAIVNYIERYTPKVLSKLAPIHSPAMCTAVYMKKYKNIGGDYAFLSPCVAKQDEFFDANTGGLVKYNVTFKKLAQFIERSGVRYESYEESEFDNEQHGLGAVYPMPGGLKANVEQYVDDVWIHQVEGQPHACHFLKNYSSVGKDAPFLVDILNCQHGCNIGTGALRDEEESLQVGRALHQAKMQAKSTKKKGIPGPDFKQFDKKLTLLDFYRSYTNKEVRPVQITPLQLENAYAGLHKFSDAQRNVDCRSCGYASCAKMAEAVAKGLNHVENCVEYFKSVLNEQKDQVESLASSRDRQAHQLREIAENILSSISESSTQTEKTMRDIESISGRMSMMKDVSSTLSSAVSSLQKEINKYTKMSDEIVDLSTQTNLLALNASVEAARAGQYGKGFAVVAEQIKRLSDQSQQSAQGALQNNENIAPILKQVDSISEQVLSESIEISTNAQNILNTIATLSALQQDIAQEASQMSAQQEQTADV